MYYYLHNNWKLPGFILKFVLYLIKSFQIFILLIYIVIILYFSYISSLLI